MGHPKISCYGQSRPNHEFRWLRFYQLFRDFCLADPNPANLLAWRKKKIRDFWVSEKNPTTEFFHFRRIHSWPQKTSFHRWVFFGSSSFEEYRSLSFSLRGREKKKIRLALSGGRLFSNFVLHNFLSVRSSCKNCNNLFLALTSLRMNLTFNNRPDEVDKRTNNKKEGDNLTRRGR